MKYIITEKDKDLILQNSLNYKYRIYIVKDKVVMDMVEGIQSIGGYNIDGDSSVRRTTSFVLYLADTYAESHIEERINLWIGYNFVVQIGVYDLYYDEYVWYECGTYEITSANTTYNAVENSLTFNLSDWYTKLNGERNGQMTGISTIEIPVEVDGVKTTIRSSFVEVIKDTGITDYIVDDIGEFYGMPDNNSDWEEYRRLNPEWNILPYNLTFNGGCHVSEILEKYKGLYPNLQIYFDIYNNLCYDMVPSNNETPIALNDEYLQKILIADSAESVSYDISSIKNVTEVYGKSYDATRYSDVESESEFGKDTITYTIPLQLYKTYVNGNIIRFTPNVKNDKSKTYVRIKDTETGNILTTLPLYYEFKEKFIEQGEIETGNTYVFKITYINPTQEIEGYYVAYFLGTYQPHALCFLTDGTDHSNDLVTLFANTEYEVTVPRYSEEFFAYKYNCDVKYVTKRVEEGSPFSVEKLGIIFETKQGEEFDAIISNSVAVSNSIYFNKKSSTTQDVVTITTKMIPWLDVQQKVSYRKQQDDKEHEYVIKSIANDLSSMTTSITMYRFYPLYV